MLEEFKSNSFYRFSFTYELMANGFYFHRGMFYRALGRRKRKQVYEFNCFQKSEVSKLEWKNTKDALVSIRNYNIERKQIITNMEEIFARYDIK